MNEFLFLFRREYHSEEVHLLSEQLPQQVKHWQNWVRKLAAEDYLDEPPALFDGIGRIVTKDSFVSIGPYAEGKECIGGVLIIKAINYEAAIRIAQQCPLLEKGGSVEVRRTL
ncbi:YciI family protein [Hymenobacter volaticus]|uniref:YciI family protein n=1 Tax=Hymenobacter volaticus TaxID=2932254 RepID=A0ABY4GF96_9BACT|nr:YciI family protein [Hymenobacter volaticus]UOQ69436.1 YciI family protein [Hymenobacter volaticus]